MSKDKRGESDITSASSADASFGRAAPAILDTLLDSDELLDHLSQRVKVLLDVAIVRITIVEDGIARYINRGERASQPDLSLASVAIQNGKGISAIVYRTGQPVFTADYWHDPAIDHNPDVDAQARQQGVVAVLCVPMRVHTSTVILLTLYKQNVHIWTEQEIYQAGHVAELVGWSVYHAYMNQVLVATNKTLLTRNREAEMVQDFNRRLVVGLIELKVVAERALAIVLELVNADVGTLHLLTEENPEELNMLVSLPQDVSVPEWLIHLKSGVGFIGRVVQSGRSQLVSNLHEFLAQNPQATIDPDPLWGSAIFVPLLLDGTVLGVLSLTSFKRGLFQTEQVRFAEIAAAQMASAIKQVTQVRLQEEQVRLETILAMAGAAAHELSQPLTAMQIELDLLRYEDTTFDAEILNRLQEGVSRITAQVRHYQKIVRHRPDHPDAHFGVGSNDPADKR